MSETMLEECGECPFFKGKLDDGCPADINGIEVEGKIRVTFGVDEQIHEEGSAIFGIHCIRSGKVALVKEGDLPGEELMVSVVSSGDVLGVPDMFNGDEYQNGAIALEPTTACFIPKEAAMELFRKDPSIMFRIMQGVCDRIRRMERHVESSGELR